MQLAPGTVVDRYVVETHLGRGGMADVYRVRHATLGHVAALKVLQSTHPGIRDRLILEGRVQANLRHPNVVAVSDVLWVAGLPCLLMEYIAGSSLDRLLERRRLTFHEADAMARGILRGLIAAHAAGTVHRDLKPANILIGDHLGEPTPKITDFGLAKALSADRSGGAAATKTGTAMGTPAYMAPEQIRNAAGVDHQADLFSMGAILYELVTGVRAFPGEDLISLYGRLGDGRYDDPRSIVPTIPDRMVAAIQSALLPDPKDRVSTAEALLALWVGTEASLSPSWEPATLAAISQSGESGMQIPVAPNAEVGATYADTASVGPGPASSLLVQESLAPREPSRPVSSPSAPPSEPRRVPWLWIGGTLGVTGVAALAVLLLFGGLAGAFFFTNRGGEGPPAPLTPSAEEVEEPLPMPIAATPDEGPSPTPSAPPDRTERGAIPVPAPTAVEPVPEAPLEAQPPEPASAPAVPEPPPAAPNAPKADAEIRLRHVLDKNLRGIERKEDRSALVGADGKRWPPGQVPAGTYAILTTFGDRAEMRSGTVYVASGGMVLVTCFARQSRCEAE